jgi:hypothetical protein
MMLKINELRDRDVSALRVVYGARETQQMKKVVRKNRAATRLYEFDTGKNTAWCHSRNIQLIGVFPRLRASAVSLDVRARGGLA